MFSRALGMTNEAYLDDDFFFFIDPATTEIYTLSLHDALPIYLYEATASSFLRCAGNPAVSGRAGRSEEHTSELQSHSDLVCRLLLEKKKHDNRSQSRRKLEI